VPVVRALPENGRNSLSVAGKQFAREIAVNTANLQIRPCAATLVVRSMRNNVESRCHAAAPAG
jgi:hypothetical protein